jgi:GT2 family glycosyltransferase
MKYHTFIVLLHYKAYSQLDQALSDLRKITKPKDTNVDIIVVDNESSLLELKKIQKKFPHVSYLPLKKNIGVPAGFNTGYKYAYDKGADFVMMLSPDLRMNKDVLVKLQNALVKDKNVGIASTKMLLKTNPPKIFFVVGRIDQRRKSAKHIGLNEVDKGQYDNVVSTEFVNCPLLIRREVFKKVGYFKPELFMYYEDIDWHLRIRKAGYALLCVKDAVAWNLENDPENKKINPKKEYYNARNLLYYVKWNYSLKEIGIVYLYTTKEAVVRIRNLIIGKEKEKSYYVLLGMYDFLRGKIGERKFN